MADLELVAVGILEENGVVTWAVFHAKLRAFDLLPAGGANDLRSLVDGIAARRPERYPFAVRLVIRLFG